MSCGGRSILDRLKQLKKDSSPISVTEEGMFIFVRFVFLNAKSPIDVMVLGISNTLNLFWFVKQYAPILIAGWFNKSLKASRLLYSRASDNGVR